MNYLISGSFAYDSVLLHNGKFHARILPESIARLNVAFGVDSHKDEFGGTGGNIAYNSALLGKTPVLCASVGADFTAYESHLIRKNVAVNYLTKCNENTAHAWILTDDENNQITAFSKGAMKNIPKIPNEAFNQDIKVWHLAPDNMETTIYLVNEAIKNNKKYFFDPGQCLPAFLENKDEKILKNILNNASGLFVNEYEAELLTEKLKVSLIDLLSEKMEFIVKTLGGKGLELITKNEIINLPVAKTEKITDPTGCGDAFRAGFLSSYVDGEDLINCAKLGAVMGSFAIEESGGQNHAPTKEQIEDRLNMSFKHKIKRGL